MAIFHEPAGVASRRDASRIRRVTRHSALALVLATAPAAAQSFDVVVDFGAPAGRQPRGGLAEGRDGCLYGTTALGGVGHGTVFRLCAGIGTTLAAFDGATTGSYPEAGLLLGSDDMLYGTTRKGGAANAGSIFRFDPVRGRVTTLHTFTGANGAEPVAELTEASDGRLYGVTSMGGSANKGTAFVIQKSGLGFTMLRSFVGSNGRNPSGRFVEASDGYLYGTTPYGGSADQGTLFRMSLAGSLTTVASFTGANGANPSAGVIQAADGHLYGTTSGGGANSMGAVFRMNLSGTLTVVRSFSNVDGFYPYGELVQATDGQLYGTTMFGGGGNGVVFKISPAGSLTVLRTMTLTDGTRPECALIQASNGRLYGTTPSNGPSGAAGTVFEVTTGGAFKRMYSFSGVPAAPHGQLVAQPDGSLFGVSASGGAVSAGTIFKLVPGVSFDVLFGFDGMSSGLGPYDGLTRGDDNALYGTAPKGGGSAVGTIYKYIPSTGTFTLLATASSSNSNGFYPYSGLVQAPNGAFYGTMSAGGSGQAGTIFKMTSAGTVASVHAFDRARTGSTPYGRLLVGNDGYLYGTASAGGGSYMGTLFRYDPWANQFTLLHTFSGGTGGNPFAGLLQGSDGRLYGTTLVGGQFGYGVVFAFDLARNQITVLHSFTGASGAYPYAGVIEAADGRLYGTTSGGGASGVGTVFSLSKSGGAVTVLHSFTGPDGSAPRGGLALANDGYLYGVTPTGGSLNNGVLYRVAPAASAAPPQSPGNLMAAAVSQSRINLTWTDRSSDETKFHIERCDGAGCSDFAQIAAVPSGTVSYADTTVAAATSYSYRARAANAAGASGYSNTASATTGTGVAVTVVAPNTAANWAVGSAHAIKWTHNGGKGSSVRIELSRDGGTSWSVIANSVSNSGDSSGAYEWLVTAPVTQQARIRVSFADGAASDTSDVNFMIAAPFITVKEPNLSSSLLSVGTIATIKWTSNLGALEQVRIELSKDGGSSYPVVIVASTESDGSTSIVVPSTWVTPTARVRITWLRNGAITDSSNASFVIK